ncbi:hypothetical protein C2S53_019760 [Perilla frutescens var. hirtella]|uniref:Myb/SANT-like domain-containing protein n=1 Tax=Perilla frutescens var. hirtella TaxID=608512 RepID=A0AAD4JIU1_PERFH|nr:hypothetical protein C2S53_019760 [Perilla frutescens var. hirtella]
MAQEYFLYDAQWTAEIDMKFIALLPTEAQNGNFRIGVNHVEVVTNAMNGVNSSFEQAFSYAECFCKMKKLQKRYTVFSYMLNYTGIYYDVATNRMHYDAQVWASIIRKHPVFAFAYQIYGDLNWEELKIIFGNPPNAPNMIDDVIHISSDEEEDVAGMNEAREVIDLSSDSSANQLFWKYVAGYKTDDKKTQPFCLKS